MNATDNLTKEIGRGKAILQATLDICPEGDAWDHLELAIEECGRAELELETEDA